MSLHHIVRHLEWELAMTTAEKDRAQAELERTQKQLRIAELHVPIEARISYQLAVELEFD